MSLSPASWEPQARLLRLGDRARIDHDCGPGRTLTIRCDDKGLHAFCFRCNDSGWLPPAPIPLAERLERLRVAQQADNAAANSVGLPGPAVRAWAAWPVNARLWLLKAGLGAHDLPRLGAYYHPPSDRVVLPVLAGSGGTSEVVFWQARALDGRLPKYLAPPVDKAGVIPKYGSSDVVTLTEDILSAYKVGTVGEGWSLLGTSMTRHVLGSLLARGCKVNVWLDPDAAGRKASAKVVKELRACGIDARPLVSERDPKLLHRGNIKEILCSK